jgi:ubiquinone/menaquinone biosynthesis C-methylase UbiE
LIVGIYFIQESKQDWMCGSESPGLHILPIEKTVSNEINLPEYYQFYFKPILKYMALHKDFPKDPYAILNPEIRWFPADEDFEKKDLRSLFLHLLQNFVSK